MIKDIKRNPYDNNGLGKPEKLKENFNGYHSRRITSEHRLVYKIIEDLILQKLTYICICIKRSSSKTHRQSHLFWCYFLIVSYSFNIFRYFSINFSYFLEDIKSNLSLNTSYRSHNFQKFLGLILYNR